MKSYFLIFTLSVFSFSALGNEVFKAAKFTVFVSGGSFMGSGETKVSLYSDPTGTGITAIPATEKAVEQALQLKGKGDFLCDVKVHSFEGARRESVKMVYSIENCAQSKLAEQ